LNKNGGKIMKQKLPIILALAVLTIVIGTVTARAQTTAVGPYYATPSWDQTLPSSTRFIVLSNFNNQAVLDRETGLVWERSPSTNTFIQPLASQHCVNLSLGTRKGWKLPTIQELASLVDLSVTPMLPSGHPFTNVQVSDSSFYWSSTISSVVSPLGWRALRFSDGAGGSSGGGVVLLAWCVRGGQGVDVQ
jgi:hypothetical protein